MGVPAPPPVIVERSTVMAASAVQAAVPGWVLSIVRAVVAEAAEVKLDHRAERRMEDMTALQERLAHQDRLVEELSDVIADQGRRIETLERRVAMLMAREAEREADVPGGVVLGNERPPHY